MMGMAVNEAYLALAGAVFGGGGLKVIEYWLTKSKVKDDSAASFRTELREEVKNLREELRKVEDDLDKWRGKYYELMDQFIKVKGELDVSLRALNETTQSVDITKLEPVDKPPLP
jgi:predicted nuclease with TOPRIM domain